MQRIAGLAAEELTEMLNKVETNCATAKFLEALSKLFFNL